MKELILKYIKKFIRKLSVPHCEDCTHLRRGYLCVSKNSLRNIFADTCRKNEHLCGKRGRWFEAKEKT